MIVLIISHLNESLSFIFTMFFFSSLFEQVCFNIEFSWERSELKLSSTRFDVSHKSNRHFSVIIVAHNRKLKLKNVKKLKNWTEGNKGRLEKMNFVFSLQAMELKWMF